MLAEHSLYLHLRIKWDLKCQLRLHCRLRINEHNSLRVGLDFRNGKPMYLFKCLRWILQAWKTICQLRTLVRKTYGHAGKNKIQATLS